MSFVAAKRKISCIAIIGLGLIGGSLAMALKAKGYKIIGISRKAKTLSLAKSKRAIDIGFTKLTSKSLKEVDLIFIATPLSLIPTYIKEIASLVKHEVFLTDVGSTKTKICEVAKKVLPKNITFIGGHPMAGTEKAGFLNAKKDLFRNCAWILTPNKSSLALKIVESVIHKIGGKTIVTTSLKHDEAVALISHIPLLVSIALCQTIMNQKNINLKNLASQIASSGFKDTTRIAGGNPILNKDLISSNLSILRRMLPSYYKELTEILKLAKENSNELLKELIKTSLWRSKLYNS